MVTLKGDWETQLGKTKEILEDRNSNGATKIDKTDYEKIGKDINQYKGYKYKSPSETERKDVIKKISKKNSTEQKKFLKNRQTKIEETKNQAKRLEDVQNQEGGVEEERKKIQKVHDKFDSFGKFIQKKYDDASLSQKMKPKNIEKTKTEPENKEKKGIFSFMLTKDGPVEELKKGEEFLVNNKIIYRVIGARITAKDNKKLVQCEIIKEGKPTGENEEFSEKELQDLWAKGDEGHFKFINPDEKKQKSLKELRAKNEPKEDKAVSPAIEEKETTEKMIERIAEILKNNKIDEVIMSGRERDFVNKKEKEFLTSTADGKERIEEWGNKIPTWGQDLDSKLALYLLNYFNKKGALGNIYNEGAKSTILNTHQGQKEPLEKIKGVRVFIDAGGEWIKFEINGEMTTLWIDHHGEGKHEPTSGTKLMYEIMQKADILKEKPEWLDKFVNLVDDIDNLKYVERTDEKGKKTFNQDYFKNKWPNSLYALAEKEIPFNELRVLVELLVEQGKDPSEPFTNEELNGGIGKIKFKGGKTIKELCEEQTKNVEKVSKSVDNALDYAKKNKLNSESSRFGKIVYHNFFQIGKSYINKKTGKEESRKNTVNNFMAYKDLKARGMDTLIAWNPKNREFFINTNFKNADLTELAKKLEEKYPGCVKNNGKDVRGIFIFGNIPDNMSEKDFLDILDKEIAKNAKEGAINNVPMPKEIEEPDQETRKEEIEKKITELMQEMPSDKDINKLEIYEGFFTNWINAIKQEKNEKPEALAYLESMVKITKEIKTLLVEKETIEKNLQNDSTASIPSTAKSDTETKTVIPEQTKPTTEKQDKKIETAETATKAEETIAKNSPEDILDTGKMENGNVEIMDITKLKIEIEKVIRKFADKLKEQNIAYKSLDINGTGNGFHIVAHLKGTGLKGIAIGNPNFIVDIKALDGQIKVVNHEFDANSIVRALAPKDKIDNLANTLGEEIKKYIEEDRKKVVKRIEIENNALKVIYS